MSAQLLNTELVNLIQESKRKHNDLRQAAERSLDELKSVRVTSEAQVAAELAQKANFANPFVIACGTKNAKFTAIAIVCLQRLIVSKALPRSKLSPVLEALQQATSAGLDVQLKILQALPSLLSNYAGEIQGELLVTALNICFILQSNKNAIVNNTSAATLQQLVVTVFDKVVAEDKSSLDTLIVEQVPVQDVMVPLRAAALDAYRVFNDICLLTENQRPEYLRFSGLPQTFGLELIESVLTNHAAIFSSHQEQAHILRTRVMPFIIAALRGKPNFATSVRLVRILYTLLRRHLSILPSESGDALEILTHILDQDPFLWKRSLCMEVFRGILAEPGLLRRIFVMYDAQKGEKDILKNLTATFVRVSTEKPQVIGLGHQSTIPVAAGSPTTDQAMLEASGVTGIMAGSVGADAHSTGISTQWSAMRVPCIDQLDKTDPPPIPESYIYSLVLACITSLSEGLAKFILPLTVPSDSRGARKRSSKMDAGGRDSPAPMPPIVEDPAASSGAETASNLERTASFKKNPVPLNPLQIENHPLFAEVQICAAFIDECWPAILATCSTFLYAALDSEYYHGLVRAFQKFAHVAGLLRLSTPRDAFLTTLGKSAVPPNVFTACLNSGATGRTSVSSPTPENASTGIFSNARGLLSVDSLVNQASSQLPTDIKTRQQSVDAINTAPSLNTRNLLCLRALLNLGIALGPTLSSSWSIILETLQQADFVLFSCGKAPSRTPTATRNPDQLADQEAASLMASFSTEIRAVETAASRLFESTLDFPNPAFVEVVEAVCKLLEKPEHMFVDQQSPRASEDPGSRSRVQSPPSSAGRTSLLKTPPVGAIGHKRMPSVSAAAVAAPNQEDQFALAKLGDLASINMERLLTHPPDVSGWDPIMAELIRNLSSTVNTAAVRARAAETLVRLLLETATAVASQPVEGRALIQERLLMAFRCALLPLEREREGRGVSVADHATDVDMHRIILEGLKNILENCGESLVSGWEVAFEIIDTIFIDRGRGEKQSETDTAEFSGSKAVLATRSVKLIRPSFSSLQLICSDFLPSLPNSCFLNLVDTLYKFSSQDDDLNVALTTVTFFWAISDFLSGKARSMSLTIDMVQESGDQALVKLAADPSHAGSGAALWMLLLLRLTSVATDQRLELRNSAIQTLMRIISAFGDSLTPEAWSICIRSVIFKLLSSIEEELHAINTSSRSPPTNDNDSNVKSEWKETAIVVLQGVAGLFASYLAVLTEHVGFCTLWEELLSHFATMLDFQVLDINAATYSALRDILSRCRGEHKSGKEQDGPAHRTIADGSLELAWDLWSREIPVARRSDTSARNSTATSSSAEKDNQKCLLVWVETLLELYSLMEKDLLNVDRVQRMLGLLHDAIQHATPTAYASDVDYVTPLQAKILQVYRMVQKTRPEGVPSVMIKQVAESVSLAFGDSQLQRGFEAASAAATAAQGGSKKRAPANASTYVAMSKESMVILQDLIVQSASDRDIYETGAVAAALEALAKPVVLKYRFTTGKTPPALVKSASAQPWRQATMSALVILQATTSFVCTVDTGDNKLREVVQTIWGVIVQIANGIISADFREPGILETAGQAATIASGDVAMQGSDSSTSTRTIIAVPPASVIDDDQSFDLAAFQELRELIIPALGSDVIPEETRTAYTEGLFRMSIMHAPAPTEAAVIYGRDTTIRNMAGRNDDGRAHGTGLAALYKQRKGRTTDPPLTRRSRMAEACLDELFDLVAVRHDAGHEDGSGLSTPTIKVQPPTPRVMGKNMTLPPTISSPSSPSAHLGDSPNPAITHPRSNHVRLARTAAPYLLVRSALTLGAYAADQPLRGRMPQPLSQRRELERVLRSLVELRAEPDAIADADAAPNVDCDERKHLIALYPLLIRCVGVAARAGDGEAGSLLGRALGEVGGEMGVGIVGLGMGLGGGGEGAVGVGGGFEGGWKGWWC